MASPWCRRLSSLNLDIKFNRPQFDAFSALGGRRTVFLGFGRGTGKSTFLRTVCWLRVAEWDWKWREAEFPFRGIRIGWLMPSRKQFVDVHGSAIANELEPGGRFAFLGGKINRTTWEISFPGGSTLIPFPASDHNSQAARGIRADLIIADECDDIGTGVYDSVAVPWLSAPWSLGEEILAGTPTRGRHGLFFRSRELGKLGAQLRNSGLSDKDALEIPQVAEIAARFQGQENQDALVLRLLRGMYAFHATYKDTPETVDPVAVAKARATTPPATFEREWLASTDAGEGLVHPFDEAFHVREPPPLDSFREFVIGMDHGFVGPGVLLLLGIQGHGEDAVVWALDEVYEAERVYPWWNEQALAMVASLPRHATYKLWPDTSEPGRLTELRNLGLNVGTVDKSDKKSGIGRVAEFLFIRQADDGERWSRMYVSPKCRNTMREFGLYRRKKHPDGTFDEEPEDKNDHAMDALLYAIVGRFGRSPAHRRVVSSR